MLCTESTRQALLTWLGAPAAWAAQRAIEAVGAPPDDVCARLQTVTEDPASAADLVSLVTRARVRASLPDDDAAIERWLLIRQAVDSLNGEAMETLGDAAQRLTCAEIASLM
jgi:hypothetical protein